MEQEPLRLQVWRIVRAIPAGSTLCYSDVGARCEPPITGFVCGRIMRSAPEDVPWWRVVSRDGSLPIARRDPDYARLQRSLLEAEGVRFDASLRVVHTKAEGGSEQ